MWFGLHTDPTGVAYALAQAQTYALRNFVDQSCGAAEEMIKLNANLSPETSAFLASLPSKIRPLNLADKFPRVLDNIAQLWDKPEEMRKHFAELMLHRRTERSGFPEDVAVELMVLHDHFYDLHPTKGGIWDYAAGLDTR